MLSGIKACVFDAYGTLFNVHAPVAALSSEIGPQAQAMSDLWRQKQLQYTWLRSLMRAHVDFWQVTGEALDYAMAAHNIDNAGLKQKLMDLYLNLEAYDDAKLALAALKSAGFQTATLSNGSQHMLDSAVNSAGLSEVLDYNLSIDDVGIYKPDPSVYQMAPDRLGIANNEICFVSANAWDASAASHFGFQVTHINRFDQPTERMPEPPSESIKSLAELPVIVAAT